MKRTTQDDQGGQADSLNIMRIDATSDSTVSLPDNSFISDAKILRDGHDLVLRAPDGDTVIVENYFVAEPAPMLATANGATLTPALVDAFVQPINGTQYAQKGTLNDISPVGLVSETSGDATIIRTDGTSTKASIGTPIFQGDVIETSGNGAVNIRFVDDTSFSVSDNARLSIDEYVFDPATQGGETGFSVLRGVFMFTSGLIGRDDPDAVTIDTPVGSIGIRGTIILGDINPGGDSQITVVEGAIVVKNDTGEQTLSQQYETVTVSGMDKDMTYKGVLAAEQVANDYNVLRSVSADLFSTIDDNQKTDDAPQDQSPEKRGDAPAESTIQTAGTDLTDAMNAEESSTETETFLTGDMLSFEENFDTAAGLRDISAVVDTGGEPQTRTESMIAGTSASFGLSAPTPVTATDPVRTATTEPTITQTAPAALETRTDTTQQTGGSGNNGTHNDGPQPIAGILNLNAIISGAQTSPGVTYIPSTATDSEHGGGVVFLGDFNGDGYDNYAFYNGNGRIFIDRNSGNLNTINLQVTPYNIANTGQISVSSAGDFNGDGQMDLIIGTALDGASAQGSVRIVTNVAGGTSIDIVGFIAGELGGYSVSVIGDFNGDGYSDLIIGAPNTASTGAAYILFGSANPTTVDVSTLANAAGGSYDARGFALFGAAGQALGASVSGIGDHDGDGFDDLVFSAPEEGTVKIVYGRAADSQITGADTLTINNIPTTTADIGTPVFGLGDFSGNGRGDLAIANYAGNSVGIFFGDATRQTGTVSFTAADLTITAGGHTLVGAGPAGDFNGDGQQDIAVAFRNGSIINIFVIYGGSGLTGTQSAFSLPEDSFYQMQLDLSGSEFNLTNPTTDPVYLNLSGGGDLNGDGFGDLAIGIPALYGNDGGVIIVRGRPEQIDLDNGSVAYQTTATSANQTLVGTTGADTFDVGYGNVSVLGGFGNDIINLSTAGFGTIHGGGGIDVLNFMTGTSIDLTNAGARIHDIEILRLSGTGQSLSVGIDDIFRLMQESDNNTLRFEAANGGNLNIDSSGLGGSLTALGFTNNGASGGFESFSFGGYTLLVDQNINLAVA